MRLKLAPCLTNQPEYGSGTRFFARKEPGLFTVAQAFGDSFAEGNRHEQRTASYQEQSVKVQSMRDGCSAESEIQDDGGHFCFRPGTAINLHRTCHLKVCCN